VYFGPARFYQKSPENSGKGAKCCLQKIQRVAEKTLLTNQSHNGILEDIILALSYINEK